MKISKADFESMKKKYDKEVKKGKPAKGKKNQDKDNQLDWVFLDRETLERMLLQTSENPKVGGIQFFLTEYTDEMAEKAHPNEAAAYTGQLTLVMRPANLDENKILSGVEETYETAVNECPYNCQPAPTN